MRSKFGTVTVKETLPLIKLICRMHNLKLNKVSDFKLASNLVSAQLN